MTFRIQRASVWGNANPLGNEGVKYGDKIYKATQKKVKSKQGTDFDIWIININSLKALIEFIEAVGSVVIDDDIMITGMKSILIYDDYIE